MSLTTGNPVNTWYTVPWDASSPQRTGAFTQDKRDPRFPWGNSLAAEGLAASSQNPTATGALSQVLAGQLASSDGGDSMPDTTDSRTDQGSVPNSVAGLIGTAVSTAAQMAGLDSLAAKGLGGGVKGGVSGKGVGVGVIDGVFDGMLAALGPVGALAAMGLNAAGFSLGRGISEARSPTHEAPGYEGGFFSDPGKGIGVSVDPSAGVGGWGGLEGDVAGYGTGDLGNGIGTTGIGIGSTGLGGLQGAMADTFGGLSDIGSDPSASNSTGGGGGYGSDPGPSGTGNSGNPGEGLRKGGLVQYRRSLRC